MATSVPRVAAVDCGTNSIRLLISEIRGPKPSDIVQIRREMTIVRLGEGVDASGKFSDAALERVRTALERYADTMVVERVTAVRMVATSATRDASNRHEFFRMTEQILSRVVPGARAEVITGTEEAELSFRGAIADLPADKGPFCVIDLGGGSTEFIVGTESEILGSHSAQIGCVRLSERILHTDPPAEPEIDAARAFAAEKVAEVRQTVPLRKAATFVGCAGTFTTLSALALGLEEYDERAIHNSTLEFDALRVLTAQLLRQTAAQRAAQPVVHEGRADVIGGGCIVVDAIMDEAQAATDGAASSFVISEKDILDGIVFGLSEQLRLEG